MPDWENEYRRILMEGRKASLRTMPRLMRLSLAKIYVAQMDTVFQRHALGTITKAGAERLVRDLRVALIRISALSEPVVKRQIMQTLKQVRVTHEKAWSAALEATGSGVNASFSGLPTDAFEAMFQRRGLGLTQSYKTLTKHSTEASAKLVENALTKMVAEGESYQQATQRIARAMATGDKFLEKAVVERGGRGGLKRWARRAGIEPNRETAAIVKKIGFDARRIAITEAAQAYHEGDRIGAIRSPAIEGMKRNLSPNHPAPDQCDVQADADLYGLGPGVYPPEVVVTNPHPHCFMPETSIQGHISTAIRSYYSGDVLKIVTSSGNRLTVTPNHPILTRGGFVPAKALREGSKCISYRGNIGAGVQVRSDVDHPPTEAREIFTTFLKYAPSLQVEGAPEYLHGDARFGEGDIDIVRPDWELLPCNNAMPADCIGNSIFALTNDATALVETLGDAFFGYERHRRSSSSLLGRKHVRLPGSGILADSVVPRYGQRFGEAANIDASRRELSHDSCPRNAQVFAQVKQRFASPVPGSAGGNINFDFGAVDPYPTLTEVVKDSDVRDAMFIRDLFDRFSAFVFCDDVVSVESCHYSGYVYDFEAVEGFLIADNILTSNCMCFNTFEMRPPSEWDNPKPEPSEPRQVTEAEARRILPNATEGQLKRSLEHTNDGVDKAFSFWNENLRAAA